MEEGAEAVVEAVGVDYGARGVAADVVLRGGDEAVATDYLAEKLGRLVEVHARSCTLDGCSRRNHAV